MKLETKILMGILVVVSVVLAALLPKTTDYALQADEGVYYRQTQEIIKHGYIDGLRQAAQNYINTPHLHQFPHPLRPVHLWVAAPFVYFFGIQGLSVVSMLFFILILWCGYQFVVRCHGSTHAVGVCAAVAFSPLLLGLSRRALTDTDTYFWALITLWLYAHSLFTQKQRHFYMFLGALCASGWAKESNYFFVPFYALITLFFHHNTPPHTHILRRISASVLIVLLPIVASCVLYFSILNTHFFAIIHIIKNLKIQSVWQYGAGSWHTYIINFIFLSPLTIVLFLMYWAHHIFYKKPVPKHHLIFMLFYIYTLIIYSFLPINVRYIGFLDWINGFFAAIFIIDYIHQKKYHITKIAWIIVPMMALNFANFNQLFIKYKVYEPLSYYVWLGQIYTPIDTATAARYTTQKVVEIKEK